METILYLAHTQEDGSLGKLALETLSAAQDTAKKLSAPFSVGLIGADVQRAADSIAQAGAAKCFGVSGPDFSFSRYATDAAACEALAKEAKATLVLVPATSRFSRTLSGVARRLGGRIDSHVSGIKIENGKLQIQRWYYRQRIATTFSRAHRPWFLLVDSGVFAAFGTSNGSATVQPLNVPVPETLKRTQVLGFQAPSSSADTIRPDAKLLFVAGAGWTKKQSDGKTHLPEAEQLILGFLEKTQSSLGSSKSLVDQGSEGEGVLSFLSHLNQVGQTGSTPRHPKGLSTCCHGEEPHAVGWRFINNRRAINLNPNCGWAQGKTDVLYVADAFQVISKINELLA